MLSGASVDRRSARPARSAIEGAIGDASLFHATMHRIALRGDNDMKRLMITLAATTLFASAAFAEEQAATEEQAAAPAEAAAVSDAEMYPNGKGADYTKPNWGVENIIDQIDGNHSLGPKKPDDYGYN
jgi:hypothetical protein